MGERIPISMAEAVTGWLDDCALAGMSPQTVKNYRSGSRRLMAKPPEGGSSRSSTPNDQGHLTACRPSVHDTPVTDFTSTLARQLMADKIRAGHALSSCKTFYGYLCSFANWCITNGYLAQSPMREVPCPKPPERPHRYLTPDELARLWKAAANSRREPSSNMLILLLLLDGLRAGELCSLRWRDVGEDRITVAFGKGGRVRVIPLRDGVRTLLASRERTDARIIPITVKALEERLQTLGKAAAVHHVHPHLLRHSWASLSLKAGMDTDTLRVLGGWSANSAMVARYTASAREDAAILRSAAFDLGTLLDADSRP